MSLQTEVKVGQIWGDTDKRRPGRQLRIERVGDGAAECLVKQGEGSDFGQRLTRISLERFSRYKLIKEVQPETQKDDVMPESLAHEATYPKETQIPDFPNNPESPAHEATYSTETQMPNADENDAEHDSPAREATYPETRAA